VIQSQLNAASRELRWNKLTASFLLTSIHLRPLADKLQTGRWFVVLVGTAVLAATCFVFADILIGFRGFSIISGVSIAIATAAALILMLYSGDDDDVLRSHENSVHTLRQIQSRVSAITEDHRLATAALRSCDAELSTAERSRIDAARALSQRQAARQVEDTRMIPLRRLYQQNWRALRDIEFERYLETVFRALGYTVETTALTGDQGVDLVVSKNGVRIAIQVKGYLHSVSNTAIQQAFAGMVHYQCDRCAVITNSRFTSGAVQLAESVRCILIDEDCFESFVMGQIDITTLHVGGVVGKKSIL
jgi:HJR/Mrr/RecB family endonuclease